MKDVVTRADKLDSRNSIEFTNELGAVEFISKPIKIDLVLKMRDSYMK